MSVQYTGPWSWGSHPYPDLVSLGSCAPDGLDLEGIFALHLSRLLSGALPTIKYVLHLPLSVTWVSVRVRLYTPSHVCQCVTYTSGPGFSIIAAWRV